MFKMFIRRPVLSIVVSLILVFIGLLSLFNLPVTQYPSISPPKVNVVANYPGANNELLIKAVVIPLEQALNGVPGMKYIESDAGNDGEGEINVVFKLGTDPNVDAINVQNRVSAATNKLPAAVVREGVKISREEPNILMYINLYSDDPKADQKFLFNYADINISPELQRVDGVGDLDILGTRNYAMRVWLKPDKLTAYNLSADDVNQALEDQSIEASPGKLGESSGKRPESFEYVLKYPGRYTKPEEYGNIILKSNANGQFVRLKDVADIDFGSEMYDIYSTLNGHPSAAITLKQAYGSNARDVIQNVKKTMTRLQKDMPKGMHYEVSYDISRFLDASIDKVIHTLIEAFLLVGVVVFIFLGDWRSALIPCLAVPVSLIGSLAVMLAFGITLNMISLFALVMAIGIVVDNAIVVVEAVQSKFDEGYRSPYTAAMKAMGGISTAIVTTSLVFMAVFIPTSFMGGTSGTYYQQFGLTMAVAVGISAINALTLCPALCSLLMTPPQIVEEGKKASFSTRFNKAFNASFHTLVLRYKNGLKHLFKHRWIAWSLLGLTGILLVVLMNTTKTGLIPDEDTGTIFVNVSTPAGSTLEQTNKSMECVTKVLKRIPEIDGNSAITGYSMLGGQMTNGGMIIVKLKNWSEREGKGQDINSVIGKVMVLTKDIKSASIFAFAQPTIMGYSTSNGVELYVQDHEGGTTEKLMANTNAFIAALQKRPEISQAYTTYSINYPQYIVDVDAAQCIRYGISPTNVLDVLNGYIGGNYASNFNAFSKLYRVMVQASPDKRLDKDALDNIYVKAGNGEMAPIGQFIKLAKTYGPQSLTRFNLYNSISVNAMPATGYSTGDVIKAISEVSKNTLPKGYGYEYTGMTREESGSSSNTVMIFAICIVFIYLILCALYESLFVPLAVMLSVPFGLLGSFLFANIFGLSNNVYMQVGLIMLIGLLSKTAILLTEYASDRRKQGMAIAAAVMSAAGVRLRPILMTALCMTVGMIPLALSSGAGANGDMSLALGVIGGMTVGTVALLFMVPVFFIAFQTLQEKLMPARKHEIEILEETK